MDQIKIVNLIPKFITFYEKAKTITSQDERFKLWKENYNFAALPPVKDYDIKARELLENAWEKYQDIEVFLNNWQPSLDDVNSYLTMVKQLLDYDKVIDLTIIFFVGGFEGNAFVAHIKKDEIGLFLPVEGSKLDILLTHELTHVVHMKKNDLEGRWERSIATIIIQEGLAMHVSRSVVPGYKDSAYTDFTKNWLNECFKHEADIVKGIIPYLGDDSPNIVEQFTIGYGTTNTQREAYFIGWICIEQLLKKGWSFNKIASIKETEFEKILQLTLQELGV